MLNSASLQVVNDSKFSQHFVQPRYDSYCFSNLPSTIEFLLTGTGQMALPPDILGDLPHRYTKVIVLFLDAFGWRFIERYAEKYSFLKTILAQGVVSKLTSQFPSTTAAHVTCMHTGLGVGQSGVYEWNYYEPLVDDIISPLTFSYAGDKLQRDTLKTSGIPATAFFPTQTFYEILQAQGIESHILQYQAYTPSTYSDIVFRGAKTHPYHTLLEALMRLVELVTAPSTAPAYYFLYFDRIDAVCHNQGPASKSFDNAVDACLTLMDKIFYKGVHGKTNDTLLMMSADHGQIEVSPLRTYYLNQRMPDIGNSLKVNKKGQLLVPAGSARDMFLHVKETHVESVVTELRQRLQYKAEVYTTQELLAQNFFGIQEPTQIFRDRVGNVIILPYKNETVWWYEEGKFDMHFQGHHGGLTPEEMEIPLLLLPLS